MTKSLIKSKFLVKELHPTNRCFSLVNYCTPRRRARSTIRRHGFPLRVFLTKYTFGLSIRVSTPHINKTTTMCSSSTSPQWEYDVFVSFRGKDVRNTFIGHLIWRLKQEGLHCFWDDEPEDAGMKMDDKIFPAIRHSKVALVVLTKNYATSRWCLNELVEILKCNSGPKTIVVIPVFYGVVPADVNNFTSTSKFGQALERLHKEGENVQQIQLWRNALQEVKEIAGSELAKHSGNDVKLLDEIIQSLYKKICQTLSLDFVRNAIGADRLAGDVIPLLRIDKKDVRMIGISGKEGIGKTMVAGAVCKGTLGKFERFIFLDEVGEAKHSNPVGLQKKLLRNLIKVSEWKSYDDFHGNIKAIKSMLRGKKILLVLDGVTEKEQIKHFGAEDKGSFGPGSRILITTRDQNLLNDLKVDDRYIVEGLNRDEAFRLFCCHAFKREEPEEGYEELSRYLAHYAGGHPLALEIWGSFLKERLKLDQWREISDELAKSRDLNSLFWSSTKKQKYFFGSTNLNSIGVDFGRIYNAYPFRVVGPCGGDRSTGTWKDEGYTDVRKIDVGFDSEAIKYITIVYNKKAVTHGTKEGATSKRTIELNYPSEYLTSISGHTKEVSRSTVLQSLTFHTNRRKPEQIGTKNDGRKFSFPYTGGKIIGFYGKCNDSHLEFIGAFYKPIPHTPIGYSGRVFGPFGGAGENSWDSGDINGISVRYADFISTITFKVNDDTSSKPQTTYGGNGRKGTFKVKLENSSEYITSFSGYFKDANDGRILISSLTFRTNKRILGPIGREEGRHFSSPSEAVKVIRFFKRTIDYLESIRAQVVQYYPFKSVGLFGSSNVSNWDDGDDHTDVREILVKIERGDRKFIRSITFYYEKNGIPFSPRRRGGPDGKDVDLMKIDSDEYLTSMSGYYMDGGITSLTFGTNKRKSKLFGREKGMHFSSPVTGGKIVGFYGNSGKNLEAIGAYFQRIPHLYPIKSIGPFGGSSGDTGDGSSEETWDYGKFKGVREIEVKHNINIHYIKFVYNDGSDRGHSVTYNGYTKGDNPKVTLVSLDYPREYLISISGYARKEGAIQSLTFYSNKSRYGPYGKEEGKYFWYPSNGSRIAGFHGSWDKTLKFIGVYVEPIPHLYPFKTVGPFGGSGGTPWDDGVHTDVRGFRISFGKAIKAIGIAYDNNGSFVSGSEHGIGYGNRGSFVLGLEPGKKPRDKYMEVLLDYPRERLISISVWVDKDESPGQPIIHDLKIFTTKNCYGPFIPESRQKRDKLMPFHIPLKQNCGRIVGFYGSVGSYLNSIGARLEPY